jgi:DNA polymerase elongation subunit (family B)
MGERTVFLDTETIPSQDPALLARFMADVTAPAQYKKQDSIDKWLDENRENVAREKLAKTSFDPAHGHICTIGFAIDDMDVRSSHAEKVGSEDLVLETFFGAIDSFHSTTFVGHYISGFDLRFILNRAIILGVKIPPCIPRDVKPWGKGIFDTMTAWSGTRDTISLDNLCKALGIEGKPDDFDGSMVADAWLAGEHDKIAEYCKDDVRKVRDIWAKFQAVGY